MPRLFRVKFDDELFANVQIDLIALRESKHVALQFLDVDLEPAGTCTRSLEMSALLMTSRALALGATATRSPAFTRNDGMSTRRPFTVMWP